MLHADHEHLTEWYLHALSTSTHAALQPALTSANLSAIALDPTAAATANLRSAGSASSLLSGTTTATTTAAWGAGPQALTASRAPSVASAASAASSHPLLAPRAQFGSSGHAYYSQEGQQAQQAGAAAVAIQLADLGLQSHHAVMVAVVMVVVGGALQRLCLDGNKVSEGLRLGLTLRRARCCFVVHRERWGCGKGGRAAP